MIRRISARAVILHDSALLCVRLATKPDRPEKGSFWCLPGGGLEAREDLLSCLRREIIEETGVAPHVGSLLYVQQFKDDHTEYMDFIYEVTNPTDYLHVDLSQTTHGTQELAELAFISPQTSNLYPKFLQTTPIKADIAAGKTQYFNNL